jgi:hypothetical protein
VVVVAPGCHAVFPATNYNKVAMRAKLSKRRVDLGSQERSIGCLKSTVRLSFEKANTSDWPPRYEELLVRRAPRHYLQQTTEGAEMYKKGIPLDIESQRRQEDVPNNLYCRVQLKDLQVSQIWSLSQLYILGYVQLSVIAWLLLQVVRYKWQHNHSHHQRWVHQATKDSCHHKHSLVYTPLVSASGS